MGRICALVVIMFVAAIVLGGCNSYHALMRPESLVSHSQYVVDCASPAGENKNNGCVPAPDPVKGPIDLDTFKFNKDDSTTAYKKAAAGVNDLVRLQDVLMERSDTACGQYLDSLYARVAARKTVLKTAALFSSAAAAIVTGTESQKILAGVSAASVGEDSIIDAEVMQNQMTTVIVNQINTIRNQIKGEINGKRANLGTYSVDSAIMDAGRYHKACAFITAITELTKNSTRAVVTKAKLSEDIVKATKERDVIIEKLQIPPADSIVLRSYHDELSRLQRKIETFDILQSTASE